MQLFDRLALLCLRLLEPERAHRLTVEALRSGLVSARPGLADPILRARVFGLDFPNPVGLAAGFDKDAELFEPMLRLGFGFVEVGSVTPLPQPGNPRPRLFRLPADEALINRLGFNNHGVEAARARLAARQGGGIVGANLGKNKDSLDAAADYRAGLLALAPLADYLVINVSSPNTPGLRALQGRAELERVSSRHSAPRGRKRDAPSPSSSSWRPTSTRRNAANWPGSCWRAASTGSSSATPRSRGRRRSRAAIAARRAASPAGRFPLALGMVERFYRLTEGRIPIIGVGGIASGEDAYRMIRAGASLVQLYTALVYRGPGLIQRIQADLARLLRRDGFATLAAAVGADHRP